MIEGVCPLGREREHRFRSYLPRLGGKRAVPAKRITKSINTVTAGKEETLSLLGKRSSHKNDSRKVVHLCQLPVSLRFNPPSEPSTESLSHPEVNRTHFADHPDAAPRPTVFPRPGMELNSRAKQVFAYINRPAPRAGQALEICSLKFCYLANL